MLDFSKRASCSEIMDDLWSSGGDLNQALRELDAINYVLGGNYVTLNGVMKLISTRADSRLHIADLGCGSGDMLKRMRSLLEKRHVDAVLTGIDANPNVISFAAAHTPTTCRINYESENIFSEGFRTRKFDIVTATLFFHHLTDEQLIGFLKQLKGQVSKGIVMNDIHRNWFSYYAIKWLTQLFSRSRMVKHDAPVSVLRAFRKRDIIDILQRAGMLNYRIKWCWAFRWQVVVRFDEVLLPVDQLRT